jgi:outer membrane protein
MKHLVAVLAFVVALSLGFAMPSRVMAQAAAPRIVYIDLQKILIESEKGKEAKKNLNDEFEKLKKTLNQKQDELQKLKDSLEKQASTMSPDTRSDKEKQYQSKLKDYQRLQGDYEGEIRQKEQEMFQKILKELEEVVRGYGESEKYTLILERSQAGILYGASTIDVTDKVIALYNDSAKKKASSKK